MANLNKNIKDDKINNIPKSASKGLKYKKLPTVITLNNKVFNKPVIIKQNNKGTSLKKLI